MSEKLSASDNPANREHLCAKQVVHETWGKGDCIPTMHAEATEDGHVAWYDVMFEHGIETRVAVEDLEITVAESHSHSGKKKMKEEDEKMVKCEDCGEMYAEGTDHECPDDDDDDEMKEGMDPVDPKELKGKHKDRKDKDIDNDGDVDSSDKFLHKRRKAISKALSQED